MKFKEWKTLMEWLAKNDKIKFHTLELILNGETSKWNKNISTLTRHATQINYFNDSDKPVPIDFSTVRDMRLSFDKYKTLSFDKKNSESSPLESVSMEGCFGGGYTLLHNL